MHDEPIDQRTAAFLDEVRVAFRAGAAPRPCPELATLFASGLTNDNGDLSATAASNANGSVLQTAGLPNGTRRHIDMVKDLLDQVRTRAVAAAVGAAVALSGLGAGGALSAPIAMISDDGDATEECVVVTDPEVGDAEGAVDPVDAVEEGADLTTDPAEAGEDPADPDDCDVDGGVDGAPVAGDPTGTTGEGDDGTPEEDAVDAAVSTELPEAPTTVSEAAHIHDFDEACGNHGAYVSHVARFGEEPDCATGARGGVAEEGTEDSTATSATGSESETDAPSDAVEPVERGKGHERQAAGTRGGRGRSRK